MSTQWRRPSGGAAASPRAENITVKRSRPRSGVLKFFLFRSLVHARYHLPTVICFETHWFETQSLETQSNAWAWIQIRLSVMLFFVGSEPSVTRYAIFCLTFLNHFGGALRAVVLVLVKESLPNECVTLLFVRSLLIFVRGCRKIHLATLGPATSNPLLLTADATDRDEISVRADGS